MSYEQMRHNVFRTRKIRLFFPNILPAFFILLDNKKNDESVMKSHAVCSYKTSNLVVKMRIR